MLAKINWSEFMRRWFGSEAGYDTVLGILRHRYVDEKQHADRFIQHAQRLHYPQFREALLRIASEELKHADSIAEKIKKLGGWLPTVLKSSPTGEKNSWRYLLEDLEEEQRCAAEAEEEMLAIESDYPDVITLLQRIDGEERHHRDEIREMLMRSDPQALYGA
jgi:bacterioferritin (cytochrome b1)